MPDWKGTLRGAAAAAGKGLAKGTRALADGVEQTARHAAWKKTLLARMSDRQALEMGKRLGVRPSDLLNEDIKGADYRSSLLLRAKLSDMVQYAKTHGVRVDDIEAGLNGEQRDREIRHYERQGVTDLAGQIADTIATFQPSRAYEYELPYQVELKGYLTPHFPSARIEEARGSARPDICIGDVAIEVKGPTRDRDLQTVADKCMRYVNHFPGGLIVVLFGVEVSENRYADWLRGIQKTFPNVFVIRIPR